jgi:hypothetical protein
MSRCTPFLDITIYHKNSSKNNKKFLNQEFHMRFLKQENGKFVLANDSITNAARVGSDPRESGLDTSYMSVFTSPQTMANANINNSNDNIFNNFSRNETNTLGDQRFLEPIVPLMSLASFQVTIDGMGYGMLSSRKGSMSLILHDRSRLSDFAPLVSLNQLVSTSIRVEFGWSHPDGDPIKSDNDIGKFLNCLRDVQYYNLTGTNLKFNNNSVNVEVQLASAGTGIKKAVSAAAGYYAPLSYASNKINKLINDIIDDESLKNGNGDKKKQEGILKKINLFRSSATSQSAVIKSENYKKILSEIDNPNITNSQKLITIAKTLGLLNRQNQVSNNSDIKTVIDSLYDTKFLTEVSRNQSVFTGRVIRDKLAVARYTPDFDLSETTRSKFQEKISGDRNNSDFKNALGDLDLEFIETISFGKLVLMYCGAPMLSTGEFAEVQVCFYPINNKAGGARRFTTASLPIEYSVVRNAIDERFKSDGNISVKGMFQLLANLFEDTGMPVYGTGKFDYEKEIEERTKADPNKLKQEQENAINTWKTNNVPKLTPEEEAKKENKDLTDAQKEAIFKEHLRKEFNEKRSSKLNDLYKNDNLPMESTEIIVTPNLQMHMEVLPVIDPSVSTKGSNSIDEFFFGAIKSKEEQGYRDDKKILRIHVYDTRANGNATGEFLNKVLNEDVADYLVGNIPKGGSKLVRVQKDSIETNGSRLISKIPTRELKEFVKRNYPNITYGAASSVVKNLSISASTRDEYSNLIMIRRKADERAAGGNKNRLSAEEEVAIYPSPYSLEILGCPFIDRGTQIFIDTGTGTDLDNVFTVNSITHTVRSGEFTTSLSLVLTFQGAVSSTRKKLANKLKTAAKEIKKNTDTKQTEQK